MAFGFELLARFSYAFFDTRDDFGGIMLMPSWIWMDLFEFDLVGCDWCTGFVEDEESRACCPIVY